VGQIGKEDRVKVQHCPAGRAAEAARSRPEHLVDRRAPRQGFGAAGDVITMMNMEIPADPWRFFLGSRGGARTSAMSAEHPSVFDRVQPARAKRLG
jgi:hypothetical protein